jgi:hypothetical protein
MNSDKIKKRVMKMELSEREKFIVHCLCAMLFGARDNASEHAISSAIEKLRMARCENISRVAAQELIGTVLDEATRGTMIITDRNVRSEDLV